MRERKPSGKKTRWGSDEDRVPYEQIMLMQSANELGLQLPNAALGLATQQTQIAAPPVDFYSERTAESNKTLEKTKEDHLKTIEETNISDEVYNLNLFTAQIYTVIYIVIMLNYVLNYN